MCKHLGLLQEVSAHLKAIALRKAKIVHNFGLSECNRVNGPQLQEVMHYRIGYGYYLP